MIQDVHPGSGFFPIPDPGNKKHKSTGSRIPIPDSDPQHWYKVIFFHFSFCILPLILLSVPVHGSGIISNLTNSYVPYLTISNVLYKSLDASCRYLHYIVNEVFFDPLFSNVNYKLLIFLGLKLR
jgi:hypothetical protein